MIEPPDDNAVQRVLPDDLVAVHDVHSRRKRTHQNCQFVRVVLRVAVGVKHPLLLRAGKAGAERRAVAAILRVMNNANLRIHPRQFL